MWGTVGHKGFGQERRILHGLNSWPRRSRDGATTHDPHSGSLSGGLAVRAVTIAVIGPADLVERVAGVAREFETLSLDTRPYRREDQADALTRLEPAPDAFLFTGPVPYHVATARTVPPAPALFVPYTGSSLYRAIYQMKEIGCNPAQVSLDVLAPTEVRYTFADMGLGSDRLHMLPFRPGQRSEMMVRFHVTLYREGRTAGAMTCVRSVFAALGAAGVPAVLLDPTRSAIAATLEQAIWAGRHTRMARSGHAARPAPLDRLLEAVRSRPTFTAHEVAHALGITPRSGHRLLEQLMERNQVELVPGPRPRRPGRPRQVYRLQHPAAGSGEPRQRSRG